ncbi:MAG: hemerythrin family protein [Acidobacteria bacterium]|nr:hemerythrin family protein [Acidobacteriota bacterium]
MKIVFDESLHTGNRAVDVQHKFLVDIINDLAEALETGQAAGQVKKTLNLLKYYAEWHFEREELCMDRFHCPAAEVNKSAHRYFIETFERFQGEYRESGGSEDIARRMYTELTAWLVGHIKKIDTQLGDCVHA